MLSQKKRFVFLFLNSYLLFALLACQQVDNKKRYKGINKVIREIKQEKESAPEPLPVDEEKKSPAPSQDSEKDPSSEGSSP